MRFRSPLNQDLDRRLDSEALAGAAASRRGFMLGAALAGVTLSASAAAQCRIALPQQTMRLRRELERELHDRSVIRVEREWTIEFHRKRAGIVVSGHQLSARVVAPEALEPLAQIERQRSTQRVFPITLDAAGQMMDAGPLVLRSDIALAAQVAGKIWSGLEASAPNPLEPLRQVPHGPQLSQRSLSDHLPADLFYPADRAERTTRTVDLPNGESGQIELSIRARSQAQQPWLRQWERRITTSIGGSRRHSSETWSLSSR